MVSLFIRILIAVVIHFTVNPMPTAFSIAAVQYTAPAKDGADSDASGLRYSCHAKAILPFLVRHRTVLASHVQRYLPHLLKTERDARRHLRTMFFADHLNIVKYNDPRQPNVYLITDEGIDRARDFMHESNESIPCRRDDPKGNHIVPELTCTGEHFLADPIWLRAKENEMAEQKLLRLRDFLFDRDLPPSAVL